MSCAIPVLDPAAWAPDATDLTAPTPPAQGPPEPVGTTSVSVTYTHPGAPAGTTWELIVTDQSDDSTVTPSSGSGLGPYVLPTTDGCRYVHQMRATGPDGQEALSLARIVVVEETAPTAAGWDTVYSLDLTGLSVATLAAGPATQTVTRASGGATVATVWTHSATNSGTVTTGASGIRADGVGAGGSVSALIDLKTASGLTLAPAVVTGLVVDLFMSGVLDMGTSANAVQVGISATQDRFSVGTNNTAQLLATASGLHTFGVGTNGTIAGGGFTNQANPAGAWCVSFLMLGGAVWVFRGSIPPTDAELDALTGAMLCSATIPADYSNAAADSKYGTSLHAGIMGQLAAGTTWTGARIRRRRTA